MTDFQYKAMDPTGHVVKGVLSADSEDMVVRRVRASGLYPISTRLAGSSPWQDILQLNWKIFKGTPYRSLSVATQELASLLQSGLELDRALGVIGDLRGAGSVGIAFLDARKRVRNGSSLAEALAQESVFPKFYIGMVRAGELGGTLGATIQRLADYLKRSFTVREAVLSALIYPLILVITAGVSISIILFVVLPEFEPLFANAGHSLPLPTQIVMGIGNALRHYGWILLLISFGGWMRFRALLKRDDYRRSFHAWLLRAPVFGTLITDLEIERLNRSLGTLLNAGVALPNALMLSREVLWNDEISNLIHRTATGLREGDTLAQHLSRSKLFPPTTLDLIQIGEETGQLAEMLIRQADLSEQHIKNQIDRLIALIVPTLTIGLGIVIAGLISSMLVAILSINDIALG